VKQRLFGTDGVRGIANKDLSPLLAYQLGRAGAHVLSELHQRPVIVVGKDTRISGDMLEAALTAGLCSVGADVLSVGVVPTPAIAYLTRFFNADAGIVISASHNPAVYNGIKFFSKDGYKLPDAMEERIEELLDEFNGKIESPTGSRVGRIHIADGKRPYIDLIKSATCADLTGIKVALDCANGAAYAVAPEVFEELGAEVYIINDHPDGTNININCGSTHPKALSEYVKKIGADVGLSFDGDADRLIAVDEKGDIVDGDHIMAICGSYFHRQGLLKKNTLVTTVMSNMGLEVALKKLGIDMVRVQVGDRYVVEEMLNKGYNFGGEQSGHILFLDHNTTGDGVLTGVNLLKVMVESNKHLSELAEVMKVFPQVLINVKVSDKSKYNGNEKIKKAIADCQNKLKDTGRILVRPSGTEPLIRVMVEGEEQVIIEEIAGEISKLIEAEL